MNKATYLLYNILVINYNIYRKVKLKIIIVMKIEIAPIKNEVEIKDYGKFFVSPLGAGAEADINIINREVSDIVEKNKRFDDIFEKDKKGEKLDTESEEYKEIVKELEKANVKIEEAKKITLEKLRHCFSGDCVDNIFNDFTFEQITEIYRKSIKGE